MFKLFWCNGSTLSRATRLITSLLRQARPTGSCCRQRYLVRDGYKSFVFLLPERCPLHPDFSTIAGFRSRSNTGIINHAKRTTERRPVAVISPDNAYPSACDLVAFWCAGWSRGSRLVRIQAASSIEQRCAPARFVGIPSLDDVFESMENSLMP